MRGSETARRIAFVPIFGAPVPDCELCRDDGGVLVARNDLLRVVLVDDPQLPGFVRVVLNAHVSEMTDLDPPARARLMQAVFAVESVQRAVFAPLKINLASLGNAVPHVHWHVIPRFADDPFYPQPIWGTRQRDTPDAVLQARHALLPLLKAGLVQALAGA
jgi:diadenosine tetraphosphate (Ap4A) HIT family hydrolase